MNKKRFFIFAILLLLELTGCKSNNSVLNGKYMGLNTEFYYEFSKDGTYTTNFYDISGFGEELDDMGITWYDYGTYRIDENKLTLFNGEEESDDIELGSDFGYVYKNMICYKWEGELPLQNQETEVTYENWSIADTIQFNKDNTVEFIYMACSGCNSSESHVHDYQTVETKTGTYEVEGNKVTCKDSDGLLTIFYDTDDGILCVDFIKE